MRARNRHGAATRSGQLPCDMKVLAALTALKATRKTIKLRFWRGFRRTHAHLPFNRDPTTTGRPDMAVTMAQGMKRLGTPIAALLGLMLIGLIAVSWLINRDALRNAVEAQIRAVTGLALTVAGA